MAEVNNTGRRSHPQERRYRRFSLRYPVDVKVGLGNSVSEFRAISNNISRGGVLLEADSAIPQHCDVSFIMTVQGNSIIGTTQIVGEGEVVRVEPNRSGAGFAIAVKCKRPISALQGYLPASMS
jgi:PilZ domain